MIKAEILGVYNNTYIPLNVCARGCLIIGNAKSNNNSDNSQADVKAVLMGLYRNELLPVLVNENGELVI